MSDVAAESVAKTPLRRGRSVLIAATTAVLIAAVAPVPLLPPGCGIGWTMNGHTLIYVPDCTHPSPPPAPPPDGPPPPDPGPPPGP